MPALRIFVQMSAYTDTNHDTDLHDSRKSQTYFALFLPGPFGSSGGLVRVHLGSV